MFDSIFVIFPFHLSDKVFSTSDVFLPKSKVRSSLVSFFVRVLCIPKSLPVNFLYFLLFSNKFRFTNCIPFVVSRRPNFGFSSEIMISRKDPVPHSLVFLDTVWCCAGNVGP